jgi:hypothetical protein
MIRVVMSRRQQRLPQTLWKEGPLSRWELHEQTGLSPNGVGELVDGMLRDRLIREGLPEPAKMGRPRVPLEIEPGARPLLGRALVPGGVEIVRFSLTGTPIGKPVAVEVSSPSALVQSAADLLAKHMDPNVLGIGKSEPLVALARFEPAEP